MEPSIAITSTITALTSALLTNDSSAISEQKEKLAKLAPDILTNLSKTSAEIIKTQSPLIEIPRISENLLKSKTIHFNNYLKAKIYNQMFIVFEGLNDILIRYHFLVPLALHLCQLHEVWSARKAGEMLICMASDDQLRGEILTDLQDGKMTMESIRGAAPESVLILLDLLDSYLHKDLNINLFDIVTSCYNQISLDYLACVTGTYLYLKGRPILSLQLSFLIKSLINIAYLEENVSLQIRSTRISKFNYLTFYEQNPRFLRKLQILQKRLLHGAALQGRNDSEIRCQALARAILRSMNKIKFDAIVGFHMIEVTRCCHAISKENPIQYQTHLLFLSLLLENKDNKIKYCFN